MHHEAGHVAIAWLLATNISGATINGQGASYFGEDRISAPEETVDLAGQLAWLMPKLGESRDAVAADILMRCHDLVLVSLAGIEAERLCCGSALANSHDEARA